MTISTGDSVTIEYTARTGDGTVFDTSRQSIATEVGLSKTQPDREYKPFTFEVGGGVVIEGLDKALVGLEEGTHSNITVSPEKAYGEWKQSRVREYDADSVEIAGGTIEEGSHIKSDDGTVAEITHAGPDIVRVDHNNPLAGNTVRFEIEIISVRTA
ncbi:peptidylprolyl isomerase [Haloquadratum walsbyi]|jgi:FKBP-type peptidyl-prolyl cis-trans isomerases 2|uniref:Peptidyl-prolyl cis-trans isomerase n=1 Tax=Haloquadratum walsbyi J07HQW2 TaxID=1238425 RepID=U1PWZ3_9EURY|nr:FKBP-type peptidyl-prolyl cis-trans isomerase [Haloquadratum walsbyi]ERG96961.1 MAG: FKBP-type peptidyl-prolyl cis-trans isomerases 2 [Haloquadratum walsbyi J07HQW2]